MPTTVNLRGLDDGLVRGAKSRAAEEGKTLKAWVVELIQAALGVKAAVAEERFEKAVANTWDSVYEKTRPRK
jgi:plasmid stability protein